MIAAITAIHIHHCEHLQLFDRKTKEYINITFVFSSNDHDHCWNCLIHWTNDLFSS
jgi:hypothetical protein